ncbi:hypothetical protein [Actinokineospora sp. NBRC 105648]|uniref:hypothetical protein n=1 Tax=Actinokineospora sp. NBRC 105648 TaxID=3032206 RepID=UPI0024A07972|nr:hypothetical protein [Actinokineospora sp. NBRC 105648]GLZ43724.1 hypothetical protein Acsp05_73480 [Actinokineospora sp. NBRC 105648]
MQTSLARIWARNTVLIGIVTAVLCLLVNAVHVRLVLVAGLALLAWNTVTVIRSWLWITEYRLFWWWRR